MHEGVGRHDGRGITTGQRTQAWPPWAHPAIVIVLITGCFHIYRGAPVDGVAFLLVGAWLAISETRSSAPQVDSFVETPARARAAWALTLVTGVLAITPRYGVLDVLVVALIGCAAVVFAATRGDLTPPARRGAAWPYAVVGLLAALNELTAYLLQTSPAAEWRHPAVSDLMDPVFAWAPTRGLLVLAWLWAGLWLLRLLPARAPQVSLAKERVEPREPTP